MNSVLTPDQEELSLEEELSLDAFHAVDVQPPHCVGMDQALGLENAPPDSTVHLNTCVLDHDWTTSWHSAVVSELLDVARHACAFSVELQMNWLRLVAPYARLCWMSTRSRGRQAQPTAEALERSMDVALGVRAA